MWHSICKGQQPDGSADLRRRLLTEGYSDESLRLSQLPPNEWNQVQPVDVCPCDYFD